MNKQLTSRIIMVRPAHFGYNPETANNNKFQSKPADVSSNSIQQLAVEEFDAMVAKLQMRNIEVIVFQEDDLEIRPDAVFPNNWLTLHEDGKLISYPMYSPLRRLERSAKLVEILHHNFVVNQSIHLEKYEEKNQFLEGTGSMIFDRGNKIIYACLSERTNPELLQLISDILNYQLITFESKDAMGYPIYHTNVMMAMGLDFVIICMESISVPDQLKLKTIFQQTGKQIIEIDFQQMNSFAGNMLQLVNSKGEPQLIMSGSAHKSLNLNQIEALESKTQILVVDIPTIEKIGGGSARCMIAENFLSPK
ncbi:MAG: amidinotransferase [Saprospiraceae bacterium]|nr:amidinotransferase [Saprospiraceae bacterium]